MITTTYMRWYDNHHIYVVGGNHHIYVVVGHNIYVVVGIPPPICGG